MKSLTEIVSESFIWGIGITRPTERQKELAAYYICGTLAASVLGIAGLFLFVVSRF